MFPEQAAPVHRIWLAGFMAAGKTTVGRLLADEMGWQFVDTDELVVSRTGRSIPELFEEGEEIFRSLEREAVREAAEGERRVIALGGGALQEEETRAFIRRDGLLVYLRVEAEELERRLRTETLSRPLVRGKKEDGLRAQITALLDDRIPHYESADLIVPAGARRDPESIVKDIQDAIER